MLSVKAGYHVLQSVTFSSCSFYDSNFPQKAFFKALNSHLDMPRQEGKEFYIMSQYPFPVSGAFETLAKQNRTQLW